MSKKKSAVKNPKALKVEELQPKETPTEVRPKLEAPKVPATPISTPASTHAPALTLKGLHQEFVSLRQVVADQAILIIQLQETLARKRKPVASNGKVQILDKQTSAIFPSKNNAYQTLLKSGDLKSLVDKGVFGADPAKNTFGWYALKRELPDRFEEIKAEEPQQ
jgi:hypothetical protein